MTQDQAIELASILKGLMPRITFEQGQIIARELLPLDYVAAQKAMTEYAEKTPDFILSGFLKSLPGRVVGELPIDRTSRTLAQEQGDAREVLEEQRQVDLAFAEIIRGMDGSAVEKLCDDAMRDIADCAFKTRIIERGPTDSRLLRTLVVELKRPEVLEGMRQRLMSK